METSMKPQENRGGEDFVLKFGNFCIDDSGSLIPPSKESSPEPRSKTFDFLDSPEFQQSSCWEPVPETAPELPEPASQYHTNNYSAGAGEFRSYGLLQMATNPEGSETLMKYLEQGMYVQETFNEVFHDIFKLMCDVSGTKIFEALLRFCNTYDLCVIMDKFVSEKNNFLLTALCKHGSYSIQAFVRRLRNTGLEGDLTSLLLAEFAAVIMMHKHGWFIFHQCFSSFGHGPNQILYCCVLALFDQISMDTYGVLAINAAIDSVQGYARRDLLSVVVKNAEQLSFDPSGNYVVQHCLSLKNEAVNQMICAALKGDFVELAQKQCGSFVVERCLEFSDEFGRGLVLAEIFKDDKTLLKLARHKPGNYVVQMALIVTRIHDQPMYEKLVKVLEPQCPVVIQNAFDEQKRKGRTG